VEHAFAEAMKNLNKLKNEPYMAYLQHKLGEWYSEAPGPCPTATVHATSGCQGLVKEEPEEGGAGAGAGGSAGEAKAEDDSDTGDGGVCVQLWVLNLISNVYSSDQHPKPCVRMGAIRDSISPLHCHS
jgi:hypothetical protein